MEPKRCLLRELPALAVVFLLAILCFPDHVVAEDATFDPPITWPDTSYPSIVLGPSGVELGQTNSISGNTVTVKNVTVPDRVPTQELPYPYANLNIYGAKNSTNATSVTGNTVILENSILDDVWNEEDYVPDLNNPSVNGDFIRSHIDGGFARNIQRIVMAFNSRLTMQSIQQPTTTKSK